METNFFKRGDPLKLKSSPSPALFLSVIRSYLVHCAGVVLDQVVQLPPQAQAHLKLGLQAIGKIANQSVHPVQRTKFHFQITISFRNYEEPFFLTLSLFVDCFKICTQVGSLQEFLSCAGSPALLSQYYFQAETFTSKLKTKMAQFLNWESPIWLMRSLWHLTEQKIIVLPIFFGLCIMNLQNQPNSSNGFTIALTRKIFKLIYN